MPPVSGLSASGLSASGQSSSGMETRFAVPEGVGYKLGGGLAQREAPETILTPSFSPAPVRLPRGNDAPLLWVSPLHYADGYGGNSIRILKALEADGVNWVCRVDGYFSSDGLPEHWIPEGKVLVPPALYDDALRRKPPARTILTSCGFSITYAVPSEANLNTGCAKRFCYTMFETTIPPHEWVNRLNSIDGTLVPCCQNIEAFRGAGIQRVSLLPHGYDPAEFYPPTSRRQGNPFIFGINGTLSPRKGADIAIKAFYAAFSPRERRNVHLRVRTRANVIPAYPGDGVGLEVVNSDFTTEQLRAWYGDVDCYLSPTRGEGFGLTPIEAAACGCAVIATEWGGTGDTLGKLPFSLVPVAPGNYPAPWGDVGEWAEPDFGALVCQMRQAAQNAARTREEGSLLSLRVKQMWPISRFPEWLEAALNT